MSQHISFWDCLKQRVALGILLGSAGLATVGLNSHPVLAQQVRPDEVWQQVYDRLPNLPRENQYVNRETGKVEPNNTLVSRLIRYHIYVKNRPPQYRLDWKLTLADYLNVNEIVEEAAYPSQATLRKNPMDADIAAIGRLNRAERDALVQVLVDSFNPQTVQLPNPAAPRSTPGTAPSR